MRLALVLVVPFLLSGCVAVGIAATTEGGKAIADDRSFGRQVDDASIYTEINHNFVQKEINDVLVNVTVNVRHARVMLTGNVDRQESAQLATELAWKAKNVQEVINEINVEPGKKFWNNANDAVIKKNLEARLLVTKGTWVVNYSIDIVNGTAYLLGAAKDQAELDRVLNVARTTRGIKRVISHLKLETELAAAPTTQPTNSNSNYFVNGNTPASAMGTGGTTTTPATAPSYSTSAPLPAPVYSSTPAPAPTPAAPY